MSKAFLALLHLLDPAVYPLEDLSSFQLRVAKRQDLADLFVASRKIRGPSVIEAGDEVLLVLDPGLEEAITAYFAPNGQEAIS